MSVFITYHLGGFGHVFSSGVNTPRGETLSCGVAHLGNALAGLLVAPAQNHRARGLDIRDSGRFSRKTSRRTCVQRFSERRKLSKTVLRVCSKGLPLSQASQRILNSPRGRDVLLHAELATSHNPVNGKINSRSPSFSGRQRRASLHCSSVP